MKQICPLDKTVLLIECNKRDTHFKFPGITYTVAKDNIKCDIMIKYSKIFNCHITFTTASLPQQHKN